MIKERNKRKEYERGHVSVEMDEGVYWYEMMARPIGVGCQPKGFVDFDDDKGHYWVVAYTRELTEDELYEYEMKPYNELSKNKNLEHDESGSVKERKVDGEFDLLIDSKFIENEKSIHKKQNEQDNTLVR